MLRSGAYLKLSEHPKPKEQQRNRPFFEAVYLSAAWAAANLAIGTL